MYLQLDMSAGLDEDDIYGQLCSAEKESADIYDIPQQEVVRMGNGLFTVSGKRVIGMLEKEALVNLYPVTLP